MSLLICKLIFLSQAKRNLAKAILGVLEQVEQFQGRATRQADFSSVNLQVRYALEVRYALGRARYALGIHLKKLPASHQNDFSLRQSAGRLLLYA